MSRFLLGRHRAALEAYNDAARLSPRDWVSPLSSSLCNILCQWFSVSRKYFTIRVCQYCWCVCAGVDCVMGVICCRSLLYTPQRLQSGMAIKQMIVL